MTIAETPDYKQERMSKIIKILNLIFAAVPIIPLAILIFLPFGAANMSLNTYMSRLQTLSPMMSFQDLTVADASVLASSSKICGFFELIAFIALIAAICGNIVYVVRSIFAPIKHLL